MGPKTLDEIYSDYRSRRDAVVQALTEDADGFHDECDPQRQNLCLYGNPDGTWRVDLPAAEVPPELPEPVLGINFARDGMERKDWLALCAVHSDAWLMSVLFFYAARFDDTGRAELFSLVNQHPTVYEVVTGRSPRNKMYKRRQVVGARGNGTQVKAPPPQQQQQFVGPAERPAPAGQVLLAEEVTPAIIGRQGELYWPDDRKWYLVQVLSMDWDARKARVQYATGEFEVLAIDEVVAEGQMTLL